MRRALATISVVCLLLSSAASRAVSPISYRFSFPEPSHRWMQVEASFTDLDAGPLELRMSRSSPGRYSIHDFAKNVYDVHTFGADGREIEPTRTDASGWRVSGHGGGVSVKYKVYGDRVDGTYLAVDTTHAHVNMPAAIMWARGLDDRPIALTFEQPTGMHWRVATQLHEDGSRYTAPNLQYLMDSPTEFGTPTLREFSVGSSRFRIALHHAGTDAQADAFARDVEKIVREERAIYGEYPAYEPGRYTFLADYLPWANGDGMEHRNSTVMTSRGSLANDAGRLLDTVAHEFFHCWNVERIRPRGLEPFDFDRPNMTGELWLAEGFTQYYAPVVLQRAGLVDIRETARTLTGLVEAVTQGSGRRFRSAEEMSEMAPFIDGGRSMDRTNWGNTVISYYSFGGAIGLALDLTLRGRSEGRVSLDDFMRAMWVKFGKPGGAREGYVDHPYSRQDAEATLAEVAHDPAFARDFFAKYIVGRDVADYASLLRSAGFSVVKRNGGRPWLGDLSLDFRGAARVSSTVSPAWPIYATGLDQDDELQELDGHPINREGDVATALSRHKPGDAIVAGYIDRAGLHKSASIVLAEDPHVDIVPTETVGALSAAQRAFRDSWLGHRS